MTDAGLHRLLPILLAVLLAGPAAADIDVDVAPGLPLSWPLPRPPILEFGELSRIPRGPKPTAGGSGSVDPVGRGGRGQSVPARGSVSQLAGETGRSGVVTFDLPQHVPWTRPGKPAPGRALVPPPGARATGWRYPPVRSPHLHWHAVTLMLSAAMYPQVTSTPAIIEQLVAIGEPAAEAARGAIREPNALGRLARRVRAYVGRLPAAMPAPSGGVGLGGQRLHRLALAELVSTHPNDPERPFAARLLGLGAEALPVLLHYSKDAHPVVRRGAVAALARLGGEPAVARLLTLISDADRVVRNRAIRALAIRHEPRAVLPLVTLLTNAGTDAGTLAISAWALGLIGDARAMAPLQAALQAPDRAADADALSALLPALARMPGDAATRALVARVEAQLRARPRRFDVRPAIKPTSPHRTTRAEVLLELCALARVAWGDAAAADQLMARLKAARKRAGPPASRRKGPEQRRGRVLYAIRLPNLFLAIDVLAGLGRRGNAWLEELLADDEARPAVRAHAIARLQLSARMPFLETPPALARIVRDHPLGRIRERALRRLALLDEALAGDTAAQLARDYADGKPSLKAAERDLVLMASLTLLGRLGRGRALLDVLLRVLARARVARAKLETLRRRHWADPKAGHPLDMTLVEIPPLVETVLLELARTRSPRARAALLEQLVAPNGPARAEAALGLGALGDPSSARALVAYLVDPDPWVRCCAYRALRRLTRNRDPALDADWIAAPPAQLRAARDRWRAAIR